MQSKTILFLYGTLKRGMKSHHFLDGQTFLREAVTMPLYRLYHCGWHPAMVLDTEGGLEVLGELWAVDEACLCKLDEYEETPNFFVRGDVVIRDCFEPVQAYFFNQPIAAGTISGDRWPFPD